jgi:hypothetical protein
MAQIFVPAYFKKTEYCDNGNKCKNLVDCDRGDNLKFKCDSFCKKFKKKIILDINISDQNIKDQKIQEIGLIAQEKLNDKEFSTVIDVHNRVQNSGYPNYLCCRIPVKSGINISFFRQNLLDYDDKIICEFFEFGAPIGFKETLLEDDNTDIVNHKGAREFDDVLKYLFKEASYGAIIGHFDKIPFPGHFKISPLNTVSKKDTLERRVILDLSFPAGNSVNDLFSKDNYLGEILQLSYPKVVTFTKTMHDKIQF